MFPRGRNPRTPAYWGGEGKWREWVKGFLPSIGHGGKDRRVQEGRESRGREGPVAGGGSCSKVLGGIDVPAKIGLFKIVNRTNFRLGASIDPRAEGRLNLAFPEFLF